MGRLRILFVEDNSGDADLVQEYLSQAEQALFEVQCAPRLASATSRLQQEQFDLLLLDLGLPDSSGLETLKHILPAAPTTPIIVLTGLQDEQAGLDAVRLGAQDYLLKGHFTPNVLIRSILYSIERKRVQDELRQSKERLQLFIDHAPTALAMFDREMRYLAVSRRWMKDYRLGDRDIVGRSHYEILPEIPDRWKEVHRRGMEGEVVRAEEDYFVRTEGPPQWLRCEVRPWYTIAGGIGGIVIFTEDITERKKTERELHSSQARLRYLLHSGPAVVYTCEASGDYPATFISENVKSQIGYEAHEFTDDPSFWISRVHPDDVATLMSGMSTLFETGKHAFEYRFLAKDGTYRWMRDEMIPVRDGNGVPIEIVGSWFDITDRKKAEDELRASEERFRRLFEQAPLGVAILDLNYRWLEVNPKLCEMLGYSRNELTQLTFEDITHPDDIEADLRQVKRLLSGEIRLVKLEKRYIRKNGEVLWIDLTGALVRDQHGNPFYFLGTIEDISERKQSQEERERLQAAIEQIPEAIVLTDTDGAIQYVNPAFETITGFARSEALGKSMSILQSGEHDAAFYGQLWDTLEAGNSWSGRVMRRSKDGRLHTEEALISPVRDFDGRILGFVAVVRDITEHLELSRQLQQAQKMEAVGTLAGGVAHDFNNILQIALGYSELILGDEELPQCHRADLQMISESAKRGADLAQRLLTFSRKAEIKPQPLNLNTRVTELRKMLERTIPKMIDIELILADNLATIQADPAQIDQILMNLAVNARDAMPDAGKLIFETANIMLDKEYARTHLDAKPGHHVVLIVTDTGSGMDWDTLEHIFEPFYTTKGVGEGTGLGLAMVHGIVKQHGGHIRCDSEPGLGTTFRIYFPALVSEEDAQQTSIGPIPRGGSETILLVEDDRLVRNLGSRILRKAGYRVIAASDGEEALDIYRRRADEISLVVLDLIMPKMGGRKCLQGLLKLNPSVKVIISSGYLPDRMGIDAVPAGAKGFVDKPYDVRQVLGVVRSVLDKG